MYLLLIWVDIKDNNVYLGFKWDDISTNNEIYVIGGMVLIVKLILWA